MGAGFDSLYFRLHADGALDGVVVYEVDFPDVTKRKAVLISDSPTLREMLGPHLRFSTGSFTSGVRLHLADSDL